MQFRKATIRDLELLVRFNLALIEDEGQQNQLSLPALEGRLRSWLRQGYRAIVFEEQMIPVGYVLYRQEDMLVYVRHFFIDRPYRRQGRGRRAMEALLAEVWPSDMRIMLDVLYANESGYAFWKSLGFTEYAVTLTLRG
jgi:GNAT superfamily N-acetyltransferase